MGDRRLRQIDEGGGEDGGAVPGQEMQDAFEERLIELLTQQHRAA